jgi:hypothetical protein
MCYHKKVLTNYFFFLYLRIKRVADAAVTPKPTTKGKINENELSPATSMFVNWYTVG